MVDMYLPNQINSPNCLVTVYVPPESVRHWPSFDRGELEAIEKTRTGLDNANNETAVYVRLPLPSPPESGKGVL